jgi:Cd2+/Zn2+-exporting ATPase
MAAADCAVSMGKLGSAAAVEASDLVLIGDDLNALPKGVAVARKTRKIVLQNIVFSIAMKTAFMVLGALGVLPLSLAVFADVGVMLLAVCNSFRIRGKY